MVKKYEKYGKKGQNGGQKYKTANFEENLDAQGVVTSHSSLIE